MPEYHIKPEVVLYLRWFVDSPDAGDPGCICSFCFQVIQADEVPLRIFSGSGNSEARLHQACAKQCVQELHPDSPQPNNPAYIHGQNAFYAGIRRGSNPYKVNDPKSARLDWYAGWDAAWEKTRPHAPDPKDFLTT
jgi:hypothetical protein